jgi:hypothetical protein
LLSKSKIPPQFGFPGGEVGQRGRQGIQAFCFHDEFLCGKTGDYNRWEGGVPMPGA